MRLLTVNAGSSSVRLVVVNLQRGGGTERRLAVTDRTRSAPQTVLRDFLSRHDAREINAVAHRIVHGGANRLRSCLIDDDVEGELDRAAPLAPLHNPVALQWIRACRSRLPPDTPQVAVFDTAFFAELPPVARSYALPTELSRHPEVRRFGFHGLAHRAMWDRWTSLHPDRVDARVISVQLGGGCSMAAVRAGRPVDTSMGFSPLEGLVMSTRSGDVDPALLMYLQRLHSLTPDRLEKFLYQESGLLGASGFSGDMRELLARDDEGARFAVDLYCYRARKYVGAYLAALGGADAVLFGGGVGENAPLVRARILDGMDWAGIRLDADINARAVGRESRIDSAERNRNTNSTEVWVLSVDEARVIAAEASAVLAVSRKRSLGNE